MTDHRGPTLRERKKLRTRRALVEEALRLFTAKGFAETTLDELVDAVQVSQRTFFRTFSSKEDVALAPEKELWAAYVAELERRPHDADAGSPLGELLETMFGALAGMAEGWESRFLASRALADRTPALTAHSLRHCAEVTDVIVERMAARTAVDELRLRLTIELMVAAWRWALRNWSAEAGEGADRDALRRWTRTAFAALPGVADLVSEERDRLGDRLGDRPGDRVGNG
ncbi:TetR/AcrR family transcriptional regulator [Streptomyces hainanensis]|uniref:TetR family transcriptional regulator n=1 Tax=Streptomyces hainanensis TaxID=402648 RepID=A0A4R4TBH1_9ACTN|nr:TetR/AcrR family transcriptional regulator [Streptomyces hainanensis]TDC72512.1 TetR family transcriptional regulator [Streptomyces hainanensis]